MLKIIATAIGVLLIIIYYLFLSDERLTNSEQKGHWFLTGLLTGYPHFATGGRKGKSWGIWIFILGAMLLVYGFWP